MMKYHTNANIIGKRLFPYLFFLLSVGFTLFSMYPTWYEVTKKDTIRPERSFELVHNFYTDFNFYLSRIRQGLEGNLTVHEKYTSEPHQGSFIHIMYLAMGWVGKWANVPWERTADIYHMARIVLSMALLMMTAAIVKRSLPEGRWQVIGFLLAVTASTWPIIVPMEDGSWRFGGHMPWWSVMDSLQRITFIPHLLAGQALLAFHILALSDRETMRKPGNWIFTGVIGFVLGIVFPPGLLFSGVTVFFVILLELVSEWKAARAGGLPKWIMSHAFGRAISLLIAVPSLLYLQLMVTFFPWKQLALADIIRPLPFKYDEYIKAVGPVLPLGILGMVAAAITKRRELIMSAAWVIAWAALLIVFSEIPQQSPLRFSEMIPHVPLGILTAWFFASLVSVVGKRVASREGKNWLKAVVTLLPIILIIQSLGHMHSSWLWQRDFVHHKIRAQYPLVPTGSFVMYPLRDFLDAMRYIQDHTPRNSVILSETTAGNYIPVYAGNYVYVGHDNTVNAEEKKLFVRSFYSGTMPQDQAYRWIKEQGFALIFFGPQEREDSLGKEIEEFYPFLERVFSNGSVILYRVP